MNTASRHIVLHGEYDISDREPLSALFGALRTDGPAVIDLTEVTYMDSTVLRELAVLRSRLNGFPVTLRVANENLHRILRVVNFDRLFEIVEAQT